MTNFTISKEKSLETSLPYHIPALLEECMEMLRIKKNGVYIDATFGGGGHSRAILERLGDQGRLYSFDRDMDAYENIPEDKRFHFVHGNFRHIENFMRYYGESSIDGIIADFGVSFHHFDTPERGFSFRTDGPLDMRMNQKAEKTAAIILSEISEEGLLSLLRAYTDLKKPVQVARAIKAYRERRPILTTGDLTEAVKEALDPRQEKKELAQVFQALRIEVNREDRDLALFLKSTQKVLRPGGRLVTLTYHSVEDRMVKNFMKTGNIEGKEEKDFFGHTHSPWKILTKKPLEATADEVTRNPRARSARLRAAELIIK